MLHVAVRHRMRGVRHDFGAVAQLGARLTGSQEVTGSNPVGSISGVANHG